MGSALHTPKPQPNAVQKHGQYEQLILFDYQSGIEVQDTDVKISR